MNHITYDYYYNYILHIPIIIIIDTLPTQNNNVDAWNNNIWLDKSITAQPCVIFPSMEMINILQNSPLIV